MKKWSQEEVDTLVQNYNKVSNEVLCQLIPSKTALAIYKKAYAMGLRKTSEIQFLNRSISRKGEKSNFWNGGVSVSSKGYRLVKMPDHHRADGKGYVMEHVLVFERECGIQVPDNCCIHHLNGRKDDNRIENLCMMTHSSHTILHHKGLKLSNETKKKISEARKKYELK